MSNKQTSRVERIHQKKKDKKDKKVEKGKRGLWKRLLLGLGIFIILGLIGGGVAIASMIRDSPELNLEELQMPQSTRIYDQDDELVDTLFHEENRINVAVDDIPDVMKDAVIAIEDKRFYEHNGVDIHRLFGAVLSNIKNGWGAEGGSTLTQQVIKRTVLTPEKTLERKVQEAWLALKLEEDYSKEDILELYMNNVYFGHGAYGIKTASATYFGEKDLSELSVSQAALLAGLPNSPSTTDPFKDPERAEKRRNQVLSAMASNNVISNEQLEEAKAEPVTDIVLAEEEMEQEDDSPYSAYISAVYDQLVDQDEVITEEEFFQGGLKIYTHLDSNIQQTMDELLKSEEIPYPDDDFEAGLSLVDTETGVIKAIGGGRNFKAIRYANYGTHIQHQPGSAIKPILDYGPAIEYLQWPTSHVLSDEKYEYSDGTPIKEWDDEYWGDVSIRRALEWSRNIPALKAFQQVGRDKAQEFASGMGIEIDPIYESSAIGGFDGVSPLEMAAAYATFGNGGTYHEPSAVKKVIFPNGDEWEPELESEQAMQDYTAYMITDMLKTVINSGTGSSANIPGVPVAGKTGSTNITEEDKDAYGIGDGLRDAWFAGYTTEYSLGVWTGYPSFKNKDGEVQYIRYDGTQNIAKQLFQSLMTEISSSDTKDFQKPDSVGKVGGELYVKGAEKPESPEKKSKPSQEKEDKEEPKEEKKEEEPEVEENNEQNTEDEEQNNEPDEENDANDTNDSNEENKENDANEEDENEANEENNKENEQESSDSNQEDQNADEPENKENNNDGNQNNGENEQENNSNNQDNEARNNIENNNENDDNSS